MTFTCLKCDVRVHRGFGVTVEWHNDALSTNVGKHWAMTCKMLLVMHPYIVSPSLFFKSALLSILPHVPYIQRIEIALL